MPRFQWRKIWSIKPLEVVTRSSKGRTSVVGVFPDEHPVLRLVGAILVEQHDERQISGRRYLTIINLTTVELGQTITFEREAA